MVERLASGGCGRGEDAVADRAEAERLSMQVEMVKQSGEDARQAHDRMMQTMAEQIRAMGGPMRRHMGCTII